MPGFFDERLGPSVSGAKDAWQEYEDEVARNRVAHAAGLPFGSIKEIGKLIGGVKSTLAVPAEAITQGAAQLAGATSLRGQAAVDVPKVELPRINTQDPKVGNWLQLIYGKDGEHWDESPEQAFETSEGRARLAALKHLVVTDPAYQERKAYWKDRIADPVDRWNTMFSEYKESRKTDASIVPKTYVGWAAEQAALTAATGGLAEMPAIAQGLKQGVPLAKLLKTAAIETSPTAFARDVSRVGVLGGSALAQLAKAVPKQAGFLTGGAIGAIENPEHPVLGAIGGAALGVGAGAAAEKIGGKLAGTWLDKKASEYGSKLFAAAAQDPRRWEALLGAGKYPGMSMLGGAAGAALVGAMDETDPVEKALLNGAIGLGIPATAKYLTKIPFPGLGRIGLSLAPAGAGAIVGAMGANTVAPPEGDETFLGQAAKGALLGAAAGTATMGAVRAIGATNLPERILYETGGDFHKAGGFLARLVPLDVVRNLKNPATGQPMFAHPIGALQTASDNVAMEVHQETQKIAEVLGAIPTQKRTSPDFRRDLFTAMRATGRNGSVKSPSALFGVDDDALNLASHLRGEFDRMFWEKVARGDMKPEQYIEGYVPRMIDMKEFRRSLSGRFLRSPTAVQNFRKSIPDEFLESEAARAIADDPSQLALFNRDQLPQHFGPREADALSQVFKKAGEYNIHPRSVLEILSSRKPLDTEHVNLMAALRGAVGKEAPPENVFDSTLLERKDTNLPTLDDPLRAYLRDVEKNARKRNFGPLIEPVKEKTADVIRGPNGDPLRVFHGTKFQGELDPASTARGALFFSEDSSYVNQYAWGETEGSARISGGSNVHPAYLTSSRLLDTTTPLSPGDGAAFFKQLAKAYWEGSDPLPIRQRERKALLDIAKKFATKQATGSVADHVGDFVRQSDLVKAAKALGYDSMKLREPDSLAPAYAVFSKEQVHSGIGTPPAPQFGKVIAPSPIQAALDEIGGKFPEHQKVLVDVTKSVMGYPRPIDEAMDTLMETIFKDPESWRVSSRMVKDLTYAGALGLKPAAAVRNLFSYMMTGSALGKDDAISGALIAQKDWDFWRGQAIQNRALANEFADELDDIREILPGALGMASEKSRDFAKTMLGMQHFTEEKFRTWTNTSAMLKVLRERGNFDPSYLRGVDAAEVKQAITAAQKAGTNEAWWSAAQLVGKKTTDLVAWRYGSAGQGVIPQGRTTKLFTMFSSWPLNYASLLLHWGSEGRVQHIVNMGVAAALVDKLALESTGLTRTTGLTAMGEGQEKDVFDAIPSGPLDASIAPLPRVLLGAGQAAKGFLTQDRGDWREGSRAVTRNLPVLTGVFGPTERAYRGMKDAEDERKKEALIRLLYGGTPQRPGDAE